ncbi:MAG: hypothetical protein ACI976_002643 [Aureispira sp.]|jgi:hypothetical protein
MVLNNPKVQSIILGADFSSKYKFTKKKLVKQLTEETLTKYSTNFY